MTMLARKIEADRYATLRKMFPNAQGSIDELERLVDAEGGRVLRVWFDMWHFGLPGTPHILARYSTNGEMKEASVAIKRD